ncbi:glycosyltransferase [Alphaproteobacteria bacterium]|nr:glycosyltransferase [Alphaproteobacteria bacterium]
MISIIIRSLNEQKYISECLEAISRQEIDEDLEIILVDSGSTDFTVKIASNYGAKVVFISPQKFTFGRSLNLGANASCGDILVFISAHCIPTTNKWLANLINPIRMKVSQYSYGRQVARDGVSKFSEGQVFKKYYPNVSAIPQVGFFCNNANSALKKETWAKLPFDENLTGLEDMELAKKIVRQSGAISYVADAEVEHIHEETWKRIMIRYEREAVALARFAPELTLGLFEAFALGASAILKDSLNLNNFSMKTFLEIILYRICQFVGSYRGGKLSNKKIISCKRDYFYPIISNKTIQMEEIDESDRSFADKSS